MALPHRVLPILVTPLNSGYRRNELTGGYGVFEMKWTWHVRRRSGCSVFPAAVSVPDASTVAVVTVASQTRSLQLGSAADYCGVAAVYPSSAFVGAERRADEIGGSGIERIGYDEQTGVHVAQLEHGRWMRSQRFSSWEEVLVAECARTKVEFRLIVESEAIGTLPPNVVHFLRPIVGERADWLFGTRLGHEQQKCEQ